MDHSPAFPTKEIRFFIDQLNSEAFVNCNHSAGGLPEMCPWPSSYMCPDAYVFADVQGSKVPVLSGVVLGLNRNPDNAVRANLTEIWNVCLLLSFSGTFAKSFEFTKSLRFADKPHWRNHPASLLNVGLQIAGTSVFHQRQSCSTLWVHQEQSIKTDNFNRWMSKLCKERTMCWIFVCR